MKFCLSPRCPNRIDKGGYCDVHRRSREQQQRGSATERGYGWTWRTRARAFLAQYPACGMRPGALVSVMSACYAEGRVTAATDVDHVAPHRGDQAKFWDEVHNWQSLCGECHKRKTQAGF